MDSFRMLKKEKLNLRYTFFSIQKKNPKNIMKIDDLREAGIGDILVEFDIITEAERTTLENEYRYKEE
jgi:accessory colonization factor AcfC